MAHAVCPQEIVDMHFDLLFGQHAPRHRSPNSPPIDPTRVLRFGHPDLVLIRRRGERSERVMHEQTEEWSLLYQDGLSQIWGRREKYDNPDRPEYLTPDQRIISSTMPRGYVNWPALPKKSQSAHPSAVTASKAAVPGA